MKKTSYFSALEAWYSKECVGDWSEQYGIKLETTDTGDWLLIVDLWETKFASRREEVTENKLSDGTFVRIKINRSKFSCIFSMGHLDDAIREFLSFIETHDSLEEDAE